MSNVYVAYFSNRVFKVGRTDSPDFRIKTLEKEMQKKGATLVKKRVFQNIYDSCAAERAMINGLVVANVDRDKSEWFKDVDFDYAMGIVDKALSEEFLRQMSLSEEEKAKNEYQELIAGILKAPHVPRWTQSAIAQQLNVSIATVSDLANGKQTDTKDSIATALRALHKRVTRKGKQGACEALK